MKGVQKLKYGLFLSKSTRFLIYILLQSQTFFLYRIWTIIISLVVICYLFCEIFKVISRMKRVQKVENRLFLCESTKFLIYFYSNHMHSSFIGMGLLKVIFQ